MVVLALPLLVVGVVVFLVLRRHGRRVEPARFLRVLALVFAALMSVLIGAFVLGETAEDPGGWAAVGLVALWLAPLVGLSVLAWFLPRPAGWVLGGLAGLVVLGGLWTALAGDAWRTFEDDHGPVRSIAVFALTLPLAILGRRRPVLAGALLIAAVVAPVLFSFLGRGGMAMSFAAAGSPSVLVGVLLLLSAAVAEPPAREDSEPVDVARH